MIFRVEVSLAAQKDLRRVPRPIATKLRTWAARVRKLGLETVRKTPGWHDEPLKGDRQGQRSIRLSLGYRAFYEIDDDGTVEFVMVMEVNKHDY